MENDQTYIDTSEIENKLRNSFLAVKKDITAIDSKQENLKSDLQDEIKESYRVLKEDIGITEKEIKFILSRLGDLEKKIEQKDKRIDELQKKLDKREDVKRNQQIVTKVNEVVDVVNSLIDMEDDFEKSVNGKIQEIVYYLDALRRLGDKVSYMEERINSMKLKKATNEVEVNSVPFITKEEFENTISNIKSNLEEIHDKSKKKKLEKVKKVLLDFFTEEVDEENKPIIPTPR